MSIVTGAALIWLLCGVWTYGRLLAEAQRVYPEPCDPWFSALFGLFGPVGLFVALGAGKSGMRFWPKPRDVAMFSERMGITPRHQCPSCGHDTHVTQEERANDDWLCLGCYEHFRLSTGERVPADLGDDEPGWSEPDEAEAAWARATMPGHANGHIIAWRSWELHMNWSGGAIDGVTLADLVGLSETELLDRFAAFQREVAEARQKPRWLLASGNGHVWQPGDPMMGYHVEGMPRAHGAGVYAVKESPGCGAVYGQIALWGSVVEHKAGYRARYAYPMKLWAGTEEIAASLRQAYGVECEVDPEIYLTSITNASLQQARSQHMQMNALGQVLSATGSGQAFGSGMGLQRQRLL